MQTKTEYLSLRIPENIKTKLRLIAISRGCTITEVIISWIESCEIGELNYT